jgi:hypothetical protein
MDKYGCGACLLRPNAAPLSQILQEPSPQSHAVPLSRILASQSPLGYAPVDASGGLHAAPLSQILASPSPLLDRPPASPSFWLHHPPASPSSLLHRPPAPPSPLLQPRRSTTLSPVRQNSRRSRTPPRPAQIPKRGPKRGPKRKAAADLNVNPDQLYVKSQTRYRYTNRRKAQVLSFWLEETPRVIRSGRPAPRGECHHRTLKEVAEHTKIPLGTVKQWALKKKMLWTPPPVLLWCSGGSLVPASRSPAHLDRSLSIRRLSSSPMRLFSNSDLGFSVTWRSRRSRRCRHGSRGRVAWWNRYHRMFRKK